MSLFRKLIGPKNNNQILLDKNEISSIVSSEVAPSELTKFGGKSIWVTVKSGSTKELLECLNLIKLEKKSWKVGIAEIQNNSSCCDVFISQPFSG